VVAKGNKVIVLDKNGKQVSQFKNTKKNTRRRVKEGRWVPEKRTDEDVERRRRKR
jgi:hypothetical protein